MKDLTLPTPALPPTEREAFETWARDKHWSVRRRPEPAGDFYSDQRTQEGWFGWQGRAALSSHHEDGGRAATDKDSLTVAPVVALGGEPPCNPHPDAPHGYNRNASHNAGRYVCDCEGWAAMGEVKGEAVAEELSKLRAKHTNLLLDLHRLINWEKPLCDFEEVNAVAAMFDLGAAPVGKARMPEWQPIETAPKDGTDILIAVIEPENGYVGHVERGYFELVEEDEEDGPWDIRGGEPWCSYEGRAAGLYWCYWSSPDDYESRGLRFLDYSDHAKYTHWMPLPKSPEGGNRSMG